MKFIFASENLKKFNEMSQMFPYKLIHEKMNLIEIQDEITRIVLDKVDKAYRLLISKYGKDICVICDDVGLEISVLNNMPGPYIKYFLKIGVDNFERIVKDTDNNANAVCALGVMFQYNGKIIKEAFVGRAPGKLVFDEDSKKTHGFDGFFSPNGSQKTYSKMSLEEKNSISHRHLALQRFYEFLDQNALILDKHHK